MTHTCGFWCFGEKSFRNCFDFRVTAGFEVDAQQSALGRDVIGMGNESRAEQLERVVVVAFFEFCEATRVGYLRVSRDAKDDEEKTASRKGAKARREFPERDIYFAPLRLCGKNTSHFITSLLA